MMDQNRWNKLEEVFDNEELFWQDDGIGEEETELNLMDWLECDSTRPSGKMIREFNDHGYRVFAAERDSFGWLIGCVMQGKTGKKIYFG